MKFRPFFVSVFLVGVTLLLFPYDKVYAEQIHPKTDYSATKVLKTGGRTMRSQVYHTKEGYRREKMHLGQNTMTIIINPEEKKVYTLFPKSKTYHIQSLDEYNKSSEEPGPEIVNRPEPMGTEKINGEKATYYKTSTERPGMKITTTFWLTDDHIMVKAKGRTKRKGQEVTFNQHLEDIERKDLPDSLFRVPDDYHKQSLDNLLGSGANRQEAIKPGNKISTQPSTGNSTSQKSSSDSDMLEELGGQVGDKLKDAFNF